MTAQDASCKTISHVNKFSLALSRHPLAQGLRERLVKPEIGWKDQIYTQTLEFQRNFTFQALSLLVFNMYERI